MKNILLTGSEGFIGSHLLELLVEQGHNVKAFVQYNSFNSWGWLESVPSNIINSVEIITGDIRDPHMVENAARNTDCIFHLAALIAIPFSYRSPDSYVDTNIKGTINVLQAAKKLQTEKVIVTSTSEVYGTALYVPIDEKHPKQGQSPYSASKIGADAIAESFYRSFGIPVTIARPFNTYGPRQSARAVIPTIITQLLNGSSEIKLGALSPTRDFVFVKDTATGFLEVAKSNLVGQQVNIATSSEISIGNLAKNIAKIINPEATIILDSDRVRPSNSEVNRLYGCNKKILKNTDWKPEHSLEEGLIKTIEWFSKDLNRSKYKSGIYNV